jgi:hypothetical protein
MPYVVQPVIKSINPLKGGTCFKIIPLHVQTFTIPTLVTIIISQHVESNERSDKQQNEPINPSFTILDNIL